MTERSALHPEKAFCSIAETGAGMAIDSRSLHPLNMYSGIRSSWAESVARCRLVQFENAYAPTFVTESGISTSGILQ